MEVLLPMYHYQAGKDPYSGTGQSQWMTTIYMEDIMDAYNEYCEDREEN